MVWDFEGTQPSSRGSQTYSDLQKGRKLSTIHSPADHVAGTPSYNMSVPFYGVFACLRSVPGRPRQVASHVAHISILCLPLFISHP